MKTFRPPGLSFEIATAAQVHPNRTDVALFVGTVARRAHRAVADEHATEAVRRPLPVALAPLVDTWSARLGGPRTAEVQRVDLRSVAGFIDSLRDAWLLAGWPAYERGDALRMEFAKLSGQRGHALLEDVRQWWPRWGAGELPFAPEDSAPPLDDSAALRHAVLTLLLTSELATRAGTRFDALFEQARALSDVPAEIRRWLDEANWRCGQLLGADPIAAGERLGLLANLPVPVDSFATFDALFAWDAAPATTTGAGTIVAPLGAAVRAFFAEGGRRCFVVRTGDAVPPTADVRRRARIVCGDKDSAVVAQLPGLTPRFRFHDDGDPPAPRFFERVMRSSDPVPSDPARYEGLDHVFALPEVSLACLPDLVAACAQPLPPALPPPFIRAADETFHECVPKPAPPRTADGTRLAPPRLNVLGLAIWREFIAHASDRLNNGGRAMHRRDVQLVASMPLLGDGRELPAQNDWVAWMAARDNWLDESRVQLAYPWLVTRDSDGCQGGVEPPEGTLLGVLARNALARGAYRSAAFAPVLRLLRTEPALDLSRALTQPVDTPAGPLTLADRVCLLLPGARGPQLASDVTLAADAPERPGAVRRLINVILQRARALGEATAFEANGEGLWLRVRGALDDLGAALVRAGALRNDPGIEAWSVRCGWQTMTQNDVDAGRLIAEVAFVPALPVQRIVVVLALRAGAATALANAA